MVILPHGRTRIFSFRWLSTYLSCTVQLQYKLAERGPGVVSRSRHFQVLYFYIKKLINNNSLQLVHLPTEQNHAGQALPRACLVSSRIPPSLSRVVPTQGFLQLTWFLCIYVHTTDRPLFCFHVLYTMLLSYCSRDDDNPMYLHLAGMVVCRDDNTYISIYIISYTNNVFMHASYVISCTYRSIQHLARYILTIIQNMLYNTLEKNSTPRVLRVLTRTLGVLIDTPGL